MFELFSNRTRPSSLSRSAPNRWDWALLPLVLAILALMAYGASQMSRPFAVGEELPISLDPVYLPYYLLRTILRMFTALAFSLLFSFVFAAIAAKYRTAEKPWSRCWTSCNRCPSWVSGHRHRALHRAVPRQPAGRGMRRHLRHLHLAGLEHGVQPVPIHAHGAARAARGGARVPAVGLAAFLAA